MENTIENAEAFVLEAVNAEDGGKPEAIWIDDVYEMLVKYAASVRPEVVVPSEKERRQIFDNLSDSNFCEQPDELSLFLVVYWDVIGKIESLNPTMTFTELNHEK